MADDNTIIEGTVKFRDGKKWKSRWCVMRKLSPVADCVHLQVYRDSKARWGGAASKASLSLQQYLGCEAGFTLDKHSHTLALLCADFTAVLAFETRERLIQWQVKVNGHLGEARQYLVVVGAGSAGKLAAGPARLTLHQRRFALTAGVPPKLLGVWEIGHLRRYGVVEGRFCFEGGSHCGKGEGLHVLVSDQAADIVRDFDLASRGQLSPKRRPFLFKKNNGIESPKSQKAFRSDVRLELNTIDRSLPPTDLRLYEDPCIGDETGAISPYWPSAERSNYDDNMGLGDTASVNEMGDGTDNTPWSGNANVMLERCMSCISKLGALSRSSTAALTPGAKHFSPAWTMEEVDEGRSDVVTDEMVRSTDKLPRFVSKTEQVCRCSVERVPDRPPKPTKLDLKLTRKPPMPLPVRSFSHAHLSSIQENSSSKIGPYENYDVPKIPSAEVDGEYYDTPKRLKECLDKDLFKMTKSASAHAIVLKKPCGCLLKFGKKPKQPTVIDTDESFQPSNCPCQKVTAWANNWIKLPYCNKAPENDSPLPNKENVKPSITDRNALYATIDLSRKTRRKSLHQEFATPSNECVKRSFETPEIDEGPLANYENLNFALSLEHYENAKDLLKRAGVTQHELDALSANLNPLVALKTEKDKSMCTKCGHPQEKGENRKSSNDEYLMMEPNSIESNKFDRDKSLPSGYTPMSPIGGFAFHTLKHHPKSAINRLLDEKSASNPTLCVSEESRQTNASIGDRVELRAPHERAEYRKRSSSADSSRFLEDVKEFDGSVGSRGSASSIETLRDIGARETGAACDCATGKHSDAESSEASKTKGAAATAGGNRDSSSSNDSGVSSWSLRGEAPGEAAGAAGFELPATTAAARRRYRSMRRAASPPAAPPRRSRSSGAARAAPPDTHKCCSAEAEVPVLTNKPLRGVVDTHSTSSGTSDMSDYIETLSICSSHSSSDTPVTMRVVRQTTSTLRPRSGKEYQPLAPRLAAGLRAHTLAHAPVHEHARAHTLAHAPVHEHAHAHTLAHAPVHEHARAHTLAHAPVHEHARAHPCTPHNNLP
ncbi:uncharacterized protein LOC123698253 [Colias croceus]|uniref:uncharacterized protein LOC123698253 n=1 Tax=Colias crocea TaxID=72248 RepID=UPI001E27CD50|nr:uncharacterized protein LOC123698253 [Colias croceus]